MSVFQARVPKSRWSSLRWTAPPAFIVGLMAVGGFFLFLFTAGSFGLLAGLAAVAVVLLIGIWTWPYVGLLALVIGGALHPFFMLLIFNFTGPGPALKAVQSWKEVIVLVVLVRVVHMVLLARRPVRLTPLDFLVGAFILCGLFYLGHPGSVQEEDIPFTTRIFGLRADGFFFLAYFVARGMSIAEPTLRRLIVTFLIVSFIIAIVAPFQFVAPGATNALFDSLGFSDYLNAQRGDQGTYYAIRQNEIPGLLIPRASSLLLSDLALAFYMLLAVPLSGAVFTLFNKPLARITMNVLVLLNIAALGLTVTRTAILASVPMLIVLFARWRGAFLGLLLVAQLAIGVAVGASAMGFSLDTVKEIFSSKDQSFQAHMVALQNSVDILQEYPAGRGLGTAGQIAQRFGAAEGVTNESWYFQIATEMGVLGMLIWIAITLTFPVVMLVRYTQVRNPWIKALCLGLGCSMVGYAFASITLHAWENLAASIIFWLFAGFAVSGPALEKRWEERAALAQAPGR